MKRLLALLASLTVVATASAEREYIVYDLTAREATAVENPDPKDKRYHEGTEMLFVRDTAVGEAFYIGVWEVTCAQAVHLGWATANAGVGQAYVTRGDTATYDFAQNHSLSGFTGLSLPTLGQWKAYAADVQPQASVNVFRGNYNYGIRTIAEWYGKYQADVEPNAFGVYDIFGNAAEYASTDGLFYGGYAKSSCEYSADPSAGAYAGKAASALSALGDFLGARLVYTPPAERTYTVTVTLDGEPVAGWDASHGYKAGERVTLPEPPLAAFHRLAEPTVTPEGLEIDADRSFLMPAEDVTVAYASVPYAIVQGVDATVSDPTPAAGATVTLTAAASEPWRTLAGWEVSEGATAPEGAPATFEFRIPETIQGGETYTFTARFVTAPRVLVYGGTVAVGEGEDLGDGFYSVGAALTLTAPATLNGGEYRFEAWVDAAGEPISTRATCQVTAGANGTVATYAATYALDAGGVQGAVIDIASTTDEEGAPAAWPLFGSLPDERQTSVPDPYGNTYRHFAYHDAGPLASFSLDDGTLTYPEAASEGGVPTVDTTDEGLTQKLQLRRVAPAEGKDFYLAVHEVTIGQMARAYKRTGTTLRHDSGDARVACTANGFYLPGHEDPWPTKFTATIAKALGRDFRQPTKAEIRAIGDSARETNANAGLGAERDEAITRKMVVCQTSAIAKPASREADPYGFYDLWGNGYEYAGDGTPFGGNYGSQFVECNLDTTLDYPMLANTLLAARPLLEVETPVTLRLEDEDGRTLQGIAGKRLFPEGVATPERAGHAFAGWTLGGEAIPLDHVLRAEDDGKVLAATWTPNATAIKVIYHDGLSGPETVYPGMATRIYAPAGKTIATLTVRGTESAVWDPETQTLTIPADAPDTLTVDATFAEPAPTPGFRLILR